MRVLAGGAEADDVDGVTLDEETPCESLLTMHRAEFTLVDVEDDFAAGADGRGGGGRRPVRRVGSRGAG